METKTIFTLSKDSGYGYNDEIRFITHRHEQGGVEYYIECVERWEDGTKTEVKSDKKMTKTQITQYVSNAIATGKVKEIKIS